MHEKYPHLFQPLKVGNVVLKNRIMTPPMSPQNHPSDHFIGPNNTAFYELRAKGGCAHNTVGDVIVDTVHGKAHSFQVHGDDPGIAPSFARTARAIKRHDCVPCMELSHAGKYGGVPCLSNPTATGKFSYGPSDEVMANGIQVKAMDEEMMKHIAQCFADTARMAYEAGFEMFILHGGHGWMINQFLSPACNRRTDQYGGSTENRCRFPIMIIQAIRAALPKGTPIDFRMSGAELYEGGYDIEEGCRIAEVLQDYVDMIHVSAGNHEVLAHIGRTHPLNFLPHGVNVYLAAEIKKHVTKVPVACVGGSNDPAMAEERIASGKADVVCVGRASICDPQWANKVRQGREDDIRKCVRCLSCLNQVKVSRANWCALNMDIGEELKALSGPVPTVAPKRVLVAGGGPGGMNAALAAAERGHDVILCEATGELGGQILCEKYIGFKDDFYDYSQWLVRQLKKKDNVEIRLNTTVTPELVREIAPDALVCAIGARAVTPPIPGIDRPEGMYPQDPKRGEDMVGQRVVIIGGGLAGCDTAVDFHRKGKDVTIVEMKDALAADAEMFYRVGLMLELDKGVKSYCGATVKAITDAGVELTDKDGNTVVLPADTVLVAAGLKSLEEESLAIVDACDRSWRVGDCVRPGLVRNAVQGGHYAGMDI